MTSPPAKTKHQHIVDTILADITSGRLPSGGRIESERKLTTVFGASLGTVQRALEALERRGVLTREHGRGTFVRGKGGFVNARYVRFRDLKGRDLPVFLQILSHVEVKTTSLLARFFGSDASLVRINRRVNVNGQFTLINQFYLTQSNFKALCRGGDLKDDTNLREVLSERIALPTLRVEQLVGFEAMKSEIARLLKCEAKQPCFAVELRGYTVGDRPLYLQRILGEPFTQAFLVIDTGR